MNILKHLINVKSHKIFGFRLYQWRKLKISFKIEFSTPKNLRLDTNIGLYALI